MEAPRPCSNGLPRQTCTTQQVSRVSQPGHSDLDLPRRERLCTLHRCLLQGFQEKICCRSHASPNDHHLRIEKADEIRDSKSKNSAGIVKYLCRQAIAAPRSIC